MASLIVFDSMISDKSNLCLSSAGWTRLQERSGEREREGEREGREGGREGEREGGGERENEGRRG